MPSFANAFPVAAIYTKMKLVILIVVFGFCCSHGMAQFDFVPDADKERTTFSFDSLLET
jgi:hypothetical protein